MQEKVDKIFAMFTISQLKLVAVTTPYYYENTRSWQPRC